MTAATETPPTPAVQPVFMPARRRRLLLAVLSLAFVLWVAALLAMYFLTVYPRRHPAHGQPAVTPPRGTVERQGS
jgi:hypothetical protein